MTPIFLLIGLLVVTIPLVALARRANVAYPIALVLGGLAIGFIPGLPRVRLDPNLVLLFFLPPLLYWEAITAPTDIMLENRTQIGALAIGLVLATTCAVAGVAHAVVPNLPWAAAFVLGAIVAPTDELASAPVLERFRMPRHLIAIVEGESLVNDALSLVLYSAAVAAATTGVFRPGHSAVFVIVAAVGAVVLGLVVGRAAVAGWRRIRDTQLQSVISLLLPFVAYVPAVQAGASGVLSVVTTGVYVSRFTPAVITPEARLRLIGFWETFVFIANALLFLLVGLQMRELAAGVFARNSWQSVLWYTLAVNVVVLAVRFAWILGTEYVPFIGASSEHPQPNWRHAVVAAWSGLRGAVSLAAALAIPLTLTGGAPFPHRDLIIFLTFTVILVTLVGGGLTLPAILSRLRIVAGIAEEAQDLQRAFAGVSAAARDRIAALQRDGRLDAEFADVLRRRYGETGERDTPRDDRNAREAAQLHVRAEHDVIAAQRQALIELRERGEIDNVVLRRVQHALDLAEERKRE